MQKIDNIKIKNFKSIRHQKIEGCKKINVFVGLPNVGKSNILEALGLFSIDNPNDKFSNFVRIENLTGLFFNGNISSRAEIEINSSNRIRLDYNSKSVSFVNEFDFNKYGFAEIDHTRFSTQRKDASELSSFSVVPPNIINSFQGKSYSSDEKSISPIYRYLFLNNLLYKPGSSYQLNVPYGENIFDVLSANEKIRKEVADFFKDYNLKFSFDTSAREFKILKNVGEDIFLISYSMIADTLQRLIFFKTAIQNNTQSILLFEEPEAHMFSPYISKFTNDMIYDENDNQFFITTHSPFVLNDLMDNLKSDELAIYIVSYEKGTGETIISRMNESDMHDAYQFGYDFFMNIDKFIS